jgi:hypothetical protein
VEECGSCPVFASFTLAFALQLRKKHGKPLVSVRKTSVRIQSVHQIHLRFSYNSLSLSHTHIHTHTHTHTNKFSVAVQSNHLQLAIEIQFVFSEVETEMLYIISFNLMLRIFKILFHRHIQNAVPVIARFIQWIIWDSFPGDEATE